MDNFDDVLNPQVEVTRGDLALLDNTALGVVDRAAIDQQITTAKRYPRSITKFLREAEALATLDEETAASCFYSLPRGGKRIEGPSARLAEIVAYSWGNLRADAEVVEEGKTHVTAMGTMFDLEKNVAIRVQVKRRITNSSGKRYDDDMIGVTGNAAISIAFRNAVFKVVPAALVRRVYEQARLASVGKAGTMESKREAALAWFNKAGVDEDRVLVVLGKKGRDDIDVEDLITLRGMVTALKEGQSTIDEMFPRPGSVGDAKTDQLNERIRQQQEPKEQSKQEAKPKAKKVAPEPESNQEEKQRAPEYADDYNDEDEAAAAERDATINSLFGEG